MSNQINATIPPADLAKALDLLKQTRALLDPHLRPLTPRAISESMYTGDVAWTLRVRAWPG